MNFSTSIILTVIGIGVIVGIVSGMVGIGGGILVIPILMVLFGFPQSRANGTSLAMMLPPIGIFAVMAYWKSGDVDIRFAALLAVGFAVGAYVGARMVASQWINPTALRMAFAVLLLYCAGRIMFRPGGRARAALETSLLIVAFAGTYATMRVLGRRWKAAPHWGTIYREKQREFIEYDYEI